LGRSGATIDVFWDTDPCCHHRSNPAVAAGEDV